MNHQIARWVFAIGVGLLVAFLSYRWITDPASRAERLLQEAAVDAARTHLIFHVDQSIEIVDPRSPNRSVGKSYVFRTEEGWEVSGYYRRDENDRWHPFLMSLDTEHVLLRLKVEDPALVEVLP